MRLYKLCLLIVVATTVLADSQGTGATLNVTAGFPPIIIGTSRYPINADTADMLKFYVQASDQDWTNMTSKCQLYKNSTMHGSPISKTIQNNTMTNICNVSPADTSNNERWHADIWVIDDDNQASANWTTLSISVGAFLGNLKNSSHNNLNVTIQFDTVILTNFSILYSLYGDESNMNITSINGTQALNHSIRIPIYENYPLIFMIRTYSNKSNTMEEWGFYNLSYDCDANIVCTEWSSCIGGYQTRTCSDLNDCEKEYMPPTNITCEIGGGGASREEEIDLFAEEPGIPGEPITCGDGKVQKDESYLNCNKDIPPTIFDYVKCISAGRDQCIYFDSYATIAAAMGISSIGLSIVLTQRFRMIKIVKSKLREFRW